MVVLGDGAAANLACVRRLENHNLLSEIRGPLRESTHPAGARVQFGYGRLGEVRLAAEITVGLAGQGGTPAAFALEADIPALLRKGVLEVLGGQLDFSCAALTPEGKSDDALRLKCTRLL